MSGPKVPTDAQMGRSGEYLMRCRPSAPITRGSQMSHVMPNASAMKARMGRAAFDDANFVLSAVICDQSMKRLVMPL
jgi:hypothetical protein